MTDDSELRDLLDSLPYYDNDLDVHPHLRRKVEAELAMQPKPSAGALHPEVPPASVLFNHPSLASELKRVENHQPIPPLDTVRYQLPAPSESRQYEESWEKAIQNAKAQLEHQRIRQTNLSLLQTYGPNAWKIQNYMLQASAARLEKAVEQLKGKTLEVNRERKSQQTLAGAHLTALETKWTELISNVLQIELANIALEAEIAQLRKREEDLTSI